MGDATSGGDLSSELRELGRNLKGAAKAAWESEESRRLQEELQTGFAALEAGLREASIEFSAGETGQRVRSSQVETQLRADLLSALRAVNAELKKATRPPYGPDGKA